MENFTTLDKITSYIHVMNEKGNHFTLRDLHKHFFILSENHKNFPLKYRFNDWTEGTGYSDGLADDLSEMLYSDFMVEEKNLVKLSNKSKKRLDENGERLKPLINYFEQLELKNYYKS